MFTIIGGDGKEYGPVSVEQLRAWIAGGRANLDTKARALGSEEWRRLGEYPEFGSTDGAPPALTPPAFPSYAPGVPTSPASPMGYAPTSMVPVGPEPGGIGARIGGACINAFLYFLAIMPGSMLLGMQLARSNPDLPERMASGSVTGIQDLDLSGATMGLVWLGVGFFGSILLQGILLGVRGQNLGKLATGTRVVLVNGEPAGFLRGAVLRFFLPVVIMTMIPVPFLGMLFFLVDFCFIFREDRRCLHDLIAGTKVVKK